jgi:class 3 adenylate cyclase
MVRMAGSDESWIDLGTATSITYISLSPGDYSFMLKAVSPDGTESKTVEYKFCIMPPFWQTTWFIALVAILSLLSLYIFYRLRVRKIERERDILELKVEERTEELKKEKNKSEKLLLNILPRDTVNELKEKGRSEARIYRHTTVLFSDFSGFTDMTTRIQPTELIESLDTFFNAFDEIADKYGVEKIKTIGDSYMAACGLPLTREDHALRMAAFALEMLDVTDRINQERANEAKTIWPLRIGLHSGSLLAGVVGTKKFAYDIWGDTVNTASRMEGNGEPGRINISIETAMLLKDYFYIAPRGKMLVKGKGEMEMFWLESFKVPFREEGNKRKPNESFLNLLNQNNASSAGDLNIEKP